MLDYNTKLEREGAGVAKVAMPRPLIRRTVTPVTQFTNSSAVPYCSAINLSMLSLPR